jgi:bis(5'-nucleosidyl)-tetraphosphatase
VSAEHSLERIERVGLTRKAGAVVFRRTEHGVRLLVLRVQTSWDFPKGDVTPGADEFAAAQRQVAHATGLADLDFPFDDAHMDALPDAGGAATRYFLAETDEGEVELAVAPQPSEARRDEWRWVSFDEAEDLLPPRLAVVLDWALATIAAG